MLWRQYVIHIKMSFGNERELFKDLSDAIKAFKYQITVNVLLSKNKENWNIEFSFVYLNSTTKTVIDSDKYMLEKSFQETLYRIDNWIIEESGWVIQSVNKEYVNASL